MHADDVAGQPGHFRQVVPDIHIVLSGEALGFQHRFRLPVPMLGDQCLGVHHGKGGVVRVERQFSLQQGDGRRRPAGLNQQFRQARGLQDVARLGAEQLIRQGNGLLIALRLGQGQSQAVAGRGAVRAVLRLRLELTHCRLGRIRIADLDPGAHGLVVGRRRELPEGMLHGLRLGVGDARLAQGVGQQKFRRLAGEAVGAAHALEHARHALRVQPRPHQGIEADAVRLLLPPPAVAQHVGLGCGLHAGDGGQPGIAAAHRGHGDGGDHAGQRRQGLRPLLLDASGEMPLA